MHLLAEVVVVVVVVVVVMMMTITITITIMPTRLLAHRIVKAPTAADGSVMSVKAQGLDQAQHEAMGLVLPFKGYKQGTRTNPKLQTPNPKPQTPNPKP